MSLDVSLYVEGSNGTGTGIFIRENGRIREITFAEWDEKHPNQEPVRAIQESDSVFSANITHNLGRMADAAGIYGIVWRPEENNITTADQLIEPLTKGIETLKADPDKFKTYSSPNGWGKYEDFIPFLEEYLEACKQYPQATVRVSR